MTRVQLVALLAGTSAASGAIKWIETDGIKFCGGGTQWGNCPVDPFNTGGTAPTRGCPSVPSAWSMNKAVAACEQLCAPDSTCLGFTWYPGNGTAADRSKCCFRSGSVADKPKCPLCTAKCFEKPPPPPPPPAPPIPKSQREVMLWVYFHNESWDNTTGPMFWDEYYKNFTTWMQPNVTAVSLCMYQVRPDGSFDYQVHGASTHVGLNQERWGVPLFRKAGMKQYPLIDANYPGGAAAMHTMMATNASRGRFIRAAIAKLKEQQFQGYNLDIEVGASDPHSRLFIDEFASALHAVGGELSADIGNCPGPDSIGMTCSDYRSSKIDRVFTMSTYEWWPPPRNCTALPHDCTRPDMQYFANKDIPLLGNKFGFGLATGPSTGLGPGYLNGSFAQAVRYIGDHPSIGWISIWANLPTRDYMQIVGSWLHGAV